MTRNDVPVRIAVFSLFALTIPAANWMIGNVGACVPDGPCLIPVGFGQMAPSGVLMIGFALVLRDWLHEISGRTWAAVAVIAGAGLSLALSPPALAAASAGAFLFSEMADLAVYSKLRERSKPVAVLVSQLIGAVIDSMLFVCIAFGSLQFSVGNTLGKLYAGAAVAAIMWVAYRRRVQC